MIPTPRQGVQLEEMVASRCGLRKAPDMLSGQEIAGPPCGNAVGDLLGPRELLGRREKSMGETPDNWMVAPLLTEIPWSWSLVVVSIPVPSVHSFR